MIRKVTILIANSSNYNALTLIQAIGPLVNVESTVKPRMDIVLYIMQLCMKLAIAATTIVIGVILDVFSVIFIFRTKQLASFIEHQHQ